MNKIIILLLFLSIFYINIFKCKNDDPSGGGNNMIGLPNEFLIIGPFPIGEREEGLDSLMSYGGIFNIPYGDDTKYPSELGNNGVVGWEKVQSTSGGYLSVDWSDSVSWEFLQQTWGWAIWLWYGYAIGTFTVPQSSMYIIDCTGTRVYFIQDLSNPSKIFEFSGDFYGYGTGQQLVQLNQSTSYNLVVRMQSSVRLNQSPNSQFSCTLQQVVVDSISSSDGNDNTMVNILNSETLVSDLVNGELASPYATVSVFNVANNGKLIESIDIVVGDYNNQSSWLKVEFLGESNLNILSGQKMAIPFALTLSTQETSKFSCPFYALLDIRSLGVTISTVNITFNCTDWGNPYLYTFLDYDDTVQYAIAVPPTESCVVSGDNNDNSTLCGIMLVTHGAGVEASSSFWMNAIPPQKYLWIILPTGRRSWPNDWESTARLNVLNAIDYLVSNLPGVPIDLKPQAIANGKTILFVGHSNGGQGAASMLERLGDMAIGGLCAAGFVKIQHYVFFNTRPGFAYIDPSLQGLLMASIAENDNDLYSSNLVGIPLMVRYGQNDTNVSPWHSRRIARMVAEQSQNETAVVISEVPNEGHWFDGILNDQYVLNWYNQLNDAVINSGGYLPSIPKVITITSHSPSSSGSRANIKILQTLNPSRVAKIQLVQITNESNQLVWMLSTQNVRRFGIEQFPKRIQGLPVSLIIDGQQFTTDFLPAKHFARLDKWLPLWNDTTDTTWVQNERSPLTSGPIRQIFEKKFTIIYGTNHTSEATTGLFEWSSVYISNFFNTYSRGSPKIVADFNFNEPSTCSEDDNYILLGNSYQNLVSSKYQSLFPVQFNPDNSFSIGPSPAYSYPGTGTIFLAPNPCGLGLILVVAGIDSQGILNALHSIPQRSGVLAPDFMVVNEIYKGAGGIISAGFWDPNWLVQTDSSYFGLTPF